MQLDLAVIQVKLDDVTIFDKSDRSAFRCLRRDMTDADTARSAGETSVGDQADLRAKPHTDDLRSRCQHFRHPRPAFRTFITDNNDATFFDFAAGDSFQCLLLGVEADGWTFMVAANRSIYGPYFDNRTFRS
ncbi:hypothetical protein D3C74_284450 [compost metagenome]